ncbi:lysogeny pheromone AimP family peptide [Bacillus inaquosorum]|nr:lysogeny pheromone AimP family peptide [Bacillus inaquosorum]MCY9084314.1 lysogeny pheromone AimP family peptide [Bacillus inaquosorum]
MRILKKVFFGLVILTALAISFVADQQSVSTASASDEVTVASAIRGA